MSLVSELSIFQATVVKLDLEKEGKAKELEFIENNIKQGLPPTPESEVKFLKVLRDQIMVMEMQNKRKEENHYIKNIAPFAKNTTAAQRVDSYLTDIGLPRPYGKFAPFMPTNIETNIEKYKGYIKKDKEAEQDLN